MLKRLHGHLPPRVGRPLTAAVLRRAARGDWRRTEVRAHRLDGPYASGEVTARRMGFTWKLDLADGASRVLYYAGAYERPLISLLVRELQPGDVVLDVGAHIGIHTLPCAAAVGSNGRVIAVEAAADTAARLRTNLLANSLADRVTIIDAALLDREDAVGLRADMTLGQGDNSVRSLFGDGPAIMMSEAIVFDRWVEENGLDRLDVVKMDIEGAEPAALAGMLGTLQRLQPRLVVIEEKAALLFRAGVELGTIGRMLGDLGYEQELALSFLVPELEVSDHDNATVVYRRRI